MRGGSKALVVASVLMGLAACSSEAEDPDYWGDTGDGSSGSPSGGAAGATGGAAGGPGGGGSSAGGGSSGAGAVSGGGGSTSGECSLEQPGATGNEPGGMIPVCCAPNAAQKAEIDAVFALVNQHRANNGVAALNYDLQLEAAIQGHCMHMGLHSFFDHDAPEAAVSSPWTRAEMCGTSASGENIAAGQSSPEAVMDSWKSSSGHNQNMLNPGFTRIGIGRYDSYWGQIFGN